MEPSHLENYLNIINYLPSEITRSLLLIQELDQKIVQNTQDLQKLQTEYLDQLNQGTDNATSLAIINETQNQNFLLSEEKIAITMQLCDMVNNHTSKLREDMQSFKREIKRADTSEHPVKRRKIETFTGSFIDVDEISYMDQGNHISEDEIVSDNNFCICNERGTGDMIECSRGRRCTRKWFHFDCVGITEAPKGEWYCSECVQIRSRKR